MTELLTERDAPWVVVGGLKDGDLGRCTRCGGVLRLKLPMILAAVALYMEAFVEEHRYCSEGSVPTLVEWPK